MRPRASLRKALEIKSTWPPHKWPAPCSSSRTAARGLIAAVQTGFRASLRQRPLFGIHRVPFCPRLEGRAGAAVACTLGTSNKPLVWLLRPRGQLTSSGRELVGGTRGWNAGLPVCLGSSWTYFPDQPQLNRIDSTRPPKPSFSTKPLSRLPG